jgi:hypothetical protein
MPKSKARVVCPVFENSTYPYHGLGLKLGDPFAITYKYYPNKTLGLVADFGKASSGLYNRYYRDQFLTYAESDTLTDDANLEYLTHKVNGDWVAELRVLWHVDAERVTPGLRLYLGAGIEFKSTKLTYQYLHNTEPNGNNNISTFGEFVQSRTTYGPQITAGIEYSYFKIPISAFMELELYNDLGVDPGYRRFQGGAGLRYVF